MHTTLDLCEMQAVVNFSDWAQKRPVNGISNAELTVIIQSTGK